MERFDCRRSVYSLMGSLGIYRLQGSLIEAELESYLCALALVQEELSTLWRDMYIQTASEETVARYERLLSLPFNHKLTRERRRELIIYRLSVAQSDFTHEGMLASLRAAGLHSQLIEHPAEERLEVVFLELLGEFTTLDKLKAMIGKMLPAHLEYELVIGEMTWVDFEEKGWDCDRFDERDFTWEEFDLAGDML